jgi:hypothetical protein
MNGREVRVYPDWVKDKQREYYENQERAQEQPLPPPLPRPYNPGDWVKKRDEYDDRRRNLEKPLDQQHHPDQQPSRRNIEEQRGREEARNEDWRIAREMSDPNKQEPKRQPKPKQEFPLNPEREHPQDQHVGRGKSPDDTHATQQGLLPPKPLPLPELARSHQDELREELRGIKPRHRDEGREQEIRR